MTRPLLVPQVDPMEVVVHDELSSCPYLHDRVSRMPLRLPLARVCGTELDRRLANGDRRTGTFLYRTECPECTACIPIRVDVTTFVPRRTHKRTTRRGDRMLVVETGSVMVDDVRIALYNRHKRARGLANDEQSIDSDGYYTFLADSCTDSFELRYLLDGQLVGVAVVDRGADALSAVYCYYEPSLARLSLGTYSILKQIELCRRWSLRFLYLGLWIAECRAMSYKIGFLPHERRQDGVWRRFDAPRAAR